MNSDDLISEARAKIIWGEPPHSVRTFLISSGVPEFEADAKIEEFQAERNAEIRSVGIRKAIVGGALVVGAGILLYLSLKDADFDRMSVRSGRGLVTICLILAIGGCYGLSRLIDGILYLVRPESVDKSISEM